MICVNQDAGGHAGTKKPDTLFKELQEFDVPLVSAGGVGDEYQLKERLDMGYSAVQMGTRFIATTECQVRPEYHEAILNAKEEDIALTDALSGVPYSIISNEATASMLKPSGRITRFLLQNRYFKHWMRALYTLRSIALLKNSSTDKKAFLSYRHPDIFQAGKSVDTIDTVCSVKEFMDRCKSCVE